MTTSPVVRGSEFLVTWSNPDDEKVTWINDRMHYPCPLSPLYRSIWGPSFEYGIATASRELEIPVLAAQVRFHNGYEYERIEMQGSYSEDEARAIAVKTDGAIRAAIQHQMERWRSDFLPRLMAMSSRLKTMDVDGPDASDLVALVDEVIAISHEQWLIHYQIVLPMMMAIELFHELYVELIGGDIGDADALLVGQQSKSVTAVIGLSRIAIQLREDGLRDFVMACSPADVLSALQAIQNGRKYAVNIATYLDEYGLQQERLDYNMPTWKEDPSLAMSTIQAYLESGYDAEVEHKASQCRAERAIFVARDKLIGYPMQVLRQFEELVQAARDATFLQEEHNYYIDQQGISLIRLFFIRVGERLVKKRCLDTADGVFMLSLDEVKAAVCGLDASGHVEERRNELEWQRQLVPPPFVGAPPIKSPSVGNPMLRVLAKYFGAPPEPAVSPNQLKGNAGSRGIKRGIARVALNFDEAKHLRSGEILVTLTTMPSWSPLFGTAAAIVTEVGGSLSHCAIVAREYAIPAVVGAIGATRIIRTGQTIVVDGGQGLVTLE